MERRTVNPWEWQDAFGFVQGNLVEGAPRTLYCAGQVPVDPNGRPMHAGNMAGQIKPALDNLESVLTEAGAFPFLVTPMSEFGNRATKWTCIEEYPFVYCCMTKQYRNYEDLPSIGSFYDIFRSTNYFRAPPSWYIVMTDVMNSTQAIEEGRYKEVNTAGSIAVMAISNIKKDMQFPFLFGGDGMTYLIPKELVEPVKDVLADTRSLVKEVFALDLRVGVIPVAELYQRGARLRVAKVQVSNSYRQAIIAGSGCDLAEALLKDPSPHNPWIIPDDWPTSTKPDYSGFTCRWNDVPSSKGETISLIVKARATKSQQKQEVLGDVLSVIQELLGNEEDYHPLNRQGLQVSVKESYREQRVMAGQRRGIGHFFYGLMLRAVIPMMQFIIKFRIPMKAQGIEIRRIKDNFIVNADFQKFDGSLKMVLALSTEDRMQLEALLEERRRQGQVYFGLHRSNRALMTCLMHMKSGNEVHFVDAADGGYALAAKALKQQISTGR